MLDIIKHTGQRSATCCCVVCRQPYEVLDRFIARDAHAGDQCDPCKYLPTSEPTKELLHQIYNYDWDTGALTYKRDFSRRHKGALVTSLHSGGYLSVSLDKRYLAHRIIWLMQTGINSEFIDHKDHDRTNNSWLNLRDVTRQDNAENKSINRNNSTGYMGVSYKPSSKKYVAYITKNRKQIYLGVFNTAEEAYQARLVANTEQGFHENHGTS